MKNNSEKKWTRKIKCKTTRKWEKERAKKERRKKVTLATHPIFQNDLLQAVYQIVHQNLRNTSHFRYLNYVICYVPFF